MRTRLLATSVAVLLALTLAGCSDDPQPIIEPAPSTTAAPSPDPTPSSTPTPEPETESAKEFIRRWQEEAQNMQSSGVSGPFRKLTHRCSDCDALADEVDRIYADGGSIAGGEVVITELRRAGSSAGQQVYEFTRTARPMEVLAPDGEVDRRFAGGKARYQLNLSKFNGSWKVLRISQLV